MSKAFTRDENQGPDLPELPPLVSSLPLGAKNYITPAGAEKLRAELANLVTEKRAPLAAAGDDHDAKRQLALLDQRIFQIEQSLQSAEIVLPTSEEDVVRFGASVMVRDQSGDTTLYRIVGLDEVDLDRNWVSWLSPIAKALLNARAGERVRFKFPSGEEQLEIVRVSYEE